MINKHAGISRKMSSVGLVLCIWILEICKN